MARNTTGAEDRQFIGLLAEHLTQNIDASIVLDWIAENFEPDDIFDTATLEAWAEGNGYVQME